MSRGRRAEELEGLTVEDLQGLARDHDVTGRSSMRKDELIEAIVAAEGAKEAGEGGEPEAASPKKALVVAVVALGAIVVVAALALLLFGGDGSGSDDPPSDVGATKTTTNTSYRLDEVRVEPAVGDLRPERGVFVLVGLTVVDESPAQRLLGGPPVLLRGGDGVNYGPAGAADQALGQAALASMALRPGEPATGEVAFDVPGAALVGAELTARDLSGGGGQTSFALGVIEPIAP